MAAKPLDLPAARKAPSDVPEPPVAQDDTAPTARLKAAAGRKPKATTVSAQDEDLPPAAAESASDEDIASAATVPPVVTEVPPGAFDGPPPLPRRKLDESVVSVLREEAAREAAAKQADAAASQMGVRETDVTAEPPVGDAAGEPGMAQADPIAGAVEAQIAAVIVQDAAIAQRVTKGRELLPNIEEINSTLRSGSDRGAESVEDSDSDEEEILQQRRRGFRTGFSLMFLVGVLLLLVYVSAPRIIAMMPESKPYMQSYVAQVNTARFWLDGMMQKASNSLASEDVE